VTKFGENRPLRSCRKVAWFTKQKNSGSAGLVPTAILAKIGRSRPKSPERCHPLTCPRIPNLVRIGCVLPDLFRKDGFFGLKSQYNNWISAYKKNMQSRHTYLGICTFLGERYYLTFALQHRPSVRLSVCLFVCLSVRPSVCL